MASTYIDGLGSYTYEQDVYDAIAAERRTLVALRKDVREYAAPIAAKVVRSMNRHELTSMLADFATAALINEREADKRTNDYQLSLAIDESEGTRTELAVQLFGYVAARRSFAPQAIIDRYNARLTAIAESLTPAPRLILTITVKDAGGTAYFVETSEHATRIDAVMYLNHCLTRSFAERTTYDYDYSDNRQGQLYRAGFAVGCWSVSELVPRDVAAALVSQQLAGVR